MEFRGVASPRTERGISSPYGPPPWHMVGRALAVWFKLADPAEARRVVPAQFEMDDDPVVRARFWDLCRETGLGPPPEASFREATVAFPVAFRGVHADYPPYMYADEPGYVAGARELMGWPVRTGDITVGAASALVSGLQVSGALRRGARTPMRLTLTLDRPLNHLARAGQVPHWLTEKFIPAVDAPGPAVHQVVHTFADSLRWGPVWSARAELAFDGAERDELAYLRPREIVRAEYWSDLELVVGYGHVLANLDRAP